MNSDQQLHQCTPQDVVLLSKFEQLSYEADLATAARRASARFSITSRRFRPSLLRVANSSTRRKAWEIPAFSRTSFRNGCSFARINHISPQLSTKRSSFNVPRSTNDAAISQ